MGLGMATTLEAAKFQSRHHHMHECLAVINDNKLRYSYRAACPWNDYTYSGVPMEQYYM